MTTITPSLTDYLAQAQLVALQALTKLLSSCPDPQELRRIATILLRFRPPRAETPPLPSGIAPIKPTPPTPRSFSAHPITPSSLADLAGQAPSFFAPLPPLALHAAPSPKPARGPVVTTFSPPTILPSKNTNYSQTEVKAPPP